MPIFLQIPWFRPEAVAIPLPDIGPLPDQLELHPFGALVAIGVLLGTSIASRRAQQEGLHPSVLGEMAAYVLIGGFVLGHMLDAIFYHWDAVQADPLFVLKVWAGLSSFGGFCGAVTGGVIWKLMRRNVPLIPFADATAYAFPFGWIFGRSGCFVVHDHPGRVTDFPLAVADYQVFGQTGPWQTRHDLGLYEVLWCLAIIPLFLYLGRKKRPRGFYLALLPILYAPVRFGLDFLRATDIGSAGDPRIALGLTPGHFGALLLFSAGVALAAYVAKRPRFAIPREARWTAEDAGEDDERTVAELLEEVGRPRGPIRLTAPDARGDHVTRWPGEVDVIDLREVDDWEALNEEIAAWPEARHRVWWIPEALDEVARATIETHLGASNDGVLDEDAERPEGLDMPLYRHSGDEPPFAIVERDDGAVVFGMLGEPELEDDAD